MRLGLPCLQQIRTAFVLKYASVLRIQKFRGAGVSRSGALLGCLCQGLGKVAPFAVFQGADPTNKSHVCEGEGAGEGSHPDPLEYFPAELEAWA